jgi:hypothetical protein
MNTFEIIDQYRITVTFEDDDNNNKNNDLDSRSGDEENSIDSRPRPKKEHVIDYV